MDFLKDLQNLYLPKGTGGKMILILILAVGSHLLVVAVRRCGRYLASLAAQGPNAKLRSIMSLAISSIVFFLYFGALGLILNQFGVSLTAYFASATVIGLAVGFGSQGLVQDVVTGLTLVFSDLFNVGDLVEVGGQTGIVRSIGMRFTVLENILGARVIMPNRNIGNVVNFRQQSVTCLVDVVLSGDADAKSRMERALREIVRFTGEQFSNILVAPPVVQERKRLQPDREIVRVTLKLWPGQGGPIEAALKPELAQRFKAIDSNYADWMINVRYDVKLGNKVTGDTKG